MLCMCKHLIFLFNEKRQRAKTFQIDLMHAYTDESSWKFSIFSFHFREEMRNCIGDVVECIHKDVEQRTDDDEEWNQWMKIKIFKFFSFLRRIRPMKKKSASRWSRLRWFSTLTWLLAYKWSRWELSLLENEIEYNNSIHTSKAYWVYSTREHRKLNLE